jgi:hypothetical protein
MVYERVFASVTLLRIDAVRGVGFDAMLGGGSENVGAKVWLE